MKKIKSVLVLFLILNIFLVGDLVLSAETAPPLVVQGFVSDRVLGNIISDNDLEVVVETEAGSKAVADTKWSEPNGNHADGHYDAVVYSFPGKKIKVTARIKGTSCSGTATELAPGGDETGLININVGICCAPNKASGLSPAGSHHITEPTDITFSWNSGVKGNNNYPDIWDDFRGPASRSSVTSPLILTLSSLTSWHVKTCNGIKGGESCCVETGVGGSFVNSPCPIPTNLKGVFENGFVVTTWESADFDSEGDKCHDVWEAVSLADGDTLESYSWRGNSESAVKTGELAVAYLVTFWKVKSCDELGSCSELALAITPTCNEISGECPETYEIKQALDKAKNSDILNQVCMEAGFAGTDEEMPLTDKEKIFSWVWLIIRLLIVSSIIYYYYERKRRGKKK